MTTINRTDRPTAVIAPLLVDLSDAGLLSVRPQSTRRGVVIDVPGTLSVFLPDPLGLAIRLRDLAAELEAMAMDGAA